ncbi:MAG: glycosyltransferase, partial [Verrucomicrobiaceae bacterium]|nr:glycosyltransferase [Verrucomicrobiaceae bacterium]
KTMLLPLGSNVAQFRPTEEVIAARIQRIRSGQKLTVLYTGTVSLQKGIIDLIEVAKAMSHRFHFRVVGNITPDAASRVSAAGNVLELIPRQPEAGLPAIYDAADLYLFPTLHDGFAAVLAQAQTACLPILATDHCAAPDIVDEGVTGWTLPVRRSDLFIDRLRWCDGHRESLATMVEALGHTHQNRDWSAVASDFSALVDRAMRFQTLNASQ